MRPTRRTVILGCAGTGKTVLAKRISEQTGVPLICLDEMLARSGTENDLPAFRAVVAEAHAGEAWISDGNFARVTFDLRLPRADLIILNDRGCSAPGGLAYACSGAVRRTGCGVSFRCFHSSGTLTEWIDRRSKRSFWLTAGV